jgi:hypothetical protein
MTAVSNPPVLRGRGPQREPPKPLETVSRETMIREAAYFRAERRGFAQGAELDDWLAAEAEIDRARAAAPAQSAAPVSAPKMRPAR